VLQPRGAKTRCVGASAKSPQGAHTFLPLFTFLQTPRKHHATLAEWVLPSRWHMPRVGSPPSGTRGEQKLASGDRMGVSRSADLWREPKLFCASFVFSAPHDPVDSTLRQIDCMCLGLARLRVAPVGSKNSLQGNGWEFLVEGALTFSRLLRFLSTTRPCQLNPSADRSHMLGVGSPPSCTRGEQKLAAGDRMGVSRLRTPLDLGATYAGTGTTPRPSLLL
jgi:hypothetical protein